MSSSQDAGNAAAMREALELVKRNANCIVCPEITCPECGTDFQMRGNLPPNVIEAVNAAVAKPPRNCDRFGGDNALLQKAYLSECGGNYNPLDANSRQAYLVGYGNWLLAPAKKGDAK